jgi:hypothetical protein
MISRPVVSSIRSRQTGQVGSSTSAGVGGARGFVVRDVGIADSVDAGLTALDEGCEDGMKGSLVMFGKLDGCSDSFAVWNVMD